MWKTPLRLCIPRLQYFGDRLDSLEAYIQPSALFNRSLGCVNLKVAPRRGMVSAEVVNKLAADGGLVKPFTGHA